ncbi:MAG: DegT/DnrJ/EryC1/StrS family aminotransferase [Planctomycetota bacterium]|jgi:dTDP-4-amino-4,6-dideoxygalactose transaminase
MLPVAAYGMAWPGRGEVASVFLDTEALFLPSGRVALAHALRALGVGPGDRVLMPAFHCGSLVEPALWLEAEVVFFHLAPDLTIDLEDLRAKLPGAKALVVAHYFGFPQPLAEIARLCEERGVGLVEDCAHAFFGEVGRVGAYAVASTMKFFPGLDGGLLASASRSLDVPALRHPGAGAELKTLVRSVETAGRYGRLFPFGPLLSRLLARRRPAPTGAPAAPPALRWFDPEAMGARGTRVSRLLMRVSAKGRIVRKRRAHYLYLRERLRGLARARPLFDALPEGVVPYVFPLLLDEPRAHFAKLKWGGVPIWRWEELAESDCAVSQDYRLRLLQLPCHQALRRRELDRMVETLLDVVGAGDPEGAR